MRLAVERVGMETKTVFDFWRKPLKLGRPLPTLPLWLTENSPSHWTSKPVMKRPVVCFG